MCQPSSAIGVEGHGGQYQSGIQQARAIKYIAFAVIEYCSIYPLWKESRKSGVCPFATLIVDV